MTRHAGTLSARRKGGKGGKPRMLSLSVEGISFFARHTADRPPEALMFARADGRPWTGPALRQRLYAACHRAEIGPPITFHPLRPTYASHSVKIGMAT